MWRSLALLATGVSVTAKTNDSGNYLNEPVLRGPNLTATSSSFGTVTALEPPPSFQFALHLIF